MGSSNHFVKSRCSKSLRPQEAPIPINTVRDSRAQLSCVHAHMVPTDFLTGFLSIPKSILWSIFMSLIWKRLCCSLTLEKVAQTLVTSLQLCLRWPWSNYVRARKRCTFHLPRLPTMCAHTLGSTENFKYYSCLKTSLMFIHLHLIFCANHFSLILLMPCPSNPSELWRKRVSDLTTKRSQIKWGIHRVMCKRRNGRGGWKCQRRL
jgi:hypothetical protein